jgi:hypothetical protein
MKQQVCKMTYRLLGTYLFSNPFEVWSISVGPHDKLAIACIIRDDEWVPNVGQHPQGVVVQSHETVLLKTWRFAHTFIQNTFKTEGQHLAQYTQVINLS